MHLSAATVDAAADMRETRESRSWAMFVTWFAGVGTKFTETDWYLPVAVCLNFSAMAA